MGQFLFLSRVFTCRPTSGRILADFINIFITRTEFVSVACRTLPRLKCTPLADATTQTSQLAAWGDTISGAAPFITPPFFLLLVH
jgi:hypothetical protein